ncbi:acyl carrier protein [Nonomuraea sp. NPDC005650]|uniref:acyl carrier protein n=1 Tax=Nonomuraea sp. NPDC005650 TaxID=3157045 RepID=UPI0033A9117C
MNEVSERVMTMLAGRAEAPSSACDAASTLEEVGLDSLDVVTLILDINREFQTTLDENELNTATTIAELVGLVSDATEAR